LPAATSPASADDPHETANAALCVIGEPVAPQHRVGRAGGAPHPHRQSASQSAATTTGRRGRGRPGLPTSTRTTGSCPDPASASVRTTGLASRAGRLPTAPSVGATAVAGAETAGTVSLLTVAAGIALYARRGAYADADLADTVAPMGAGSVVGAVVGGLLVGIVRAAALKFALGGILNASALRVFHVRRA
jgi:hypothetical protein